MRIEIPQLPQTTSERIPSYPLRSTPCSRQSPEHKCLLCLLYDLFLTDFTRVGSNYTLVSTHQLRALESPFEERGRSTDTEREGSGESCHRRCLLSSSSSFFAIPSSPSLHRIPPLLLFQPPHLNQPMNQTNPPRSLAPQDFPFSAGEGIERQAPILVWLKSSRNRRIAKGRHVSSIPPFDLAPFPVFTFMAPLTLVGWKLGNLTLQCRNRHSPVTQSHGEARGNCRNSYPLMNAIKVARTASYHRKFDVYFALRGRLITPQSL